MKRIRLIVFFVLLVLALNIKAQMLMYAHDTLATRRLWVDTPLVKQPEPLRAGGLVVFTNLTVWSVDRFISKSEFSKISCATIKRNFQTGFVWDNDPFQTNLFLHPYHGGLYFNAARSSGMSFWQSAPFSVAGSLMWEFFMENEFPSYNDLIVTSLGGVGLGEVTFRLSDWIIDESTSGLDRVGRELSAFLISPVRGINRCLSGNLWKRSRQKGNVLPSFPVNWYVMAGYGHQYDLLSKYEFDPRHYLTLGFVYGNPYDEANSRPYDFFSIQVSANLADKCGIIDRARCLGMLYSDKIKTRSLRNDLTWGLFQQFIYQEVPGDATKLNRPPFRLSETASFGPGLLFRRQIGEKTFFCASAFGSAILLGGTQSDHYDVDERTYNLGSGCSLKGVAEWRIEKRLAVRLRAEEYYLNTWIGGNPPNDEVDFVWSPMGNDCSSDLSVGLLNLEYRVGSRFLIGAEAGYYYHHTDYKDFPDTHRWVYDNRFSVGVML